MARGVFFDLFGTLLVYGDMKRAWSDWLDAFHSDLGAYGLALPRSEFAEECDSFMAMEEPPPAADGSTIFERRIRGLCARLCLDLDLGEITRVADHIAGVWQEHIDLDPDAREVLGILRESRLTALVSNFDHPPHVRRVLETHGLTEFFPSIVISGEVGVKKPDPGIFVPALRQTGLRPSEVVYVGDTDDDVAGARAAGISPILIRRPVGGTGGEALDFTSCESGTLPGVEADSDGSVRVVQGLDELPALFA